VIYETKVSEILSLYEFSVGRGLLEMLCNSFKKEITCNVDINEDLLNKFHKYNPNYVFYEPGRYSTEVKLKSIHIILLSTNVENFLFDISDFILYGEEGHSPNLEWVNNDSSNVYNECYINL